MGPKGPGSSTTSRGVAVSLASSISFGVIYFLTPMLHPLPGLGVWAVRVLISLPFVTVILLASRDWQLVTDIARKIRRKPVIVLGLLVTAAILSAQLWLFAWAPLNGRGMQVALGYFLLPLVLVVIGRFLYKDRMTWWQWAAAGTALIGVIYEVIRVGGIGWETLLVALGYPVYFVLRRAMGTGHLGGMWWDLALVTVFAGIVTVLTFWDGSMIEANPSLWWSAPGVSLIAAAALSFYLAASRLLSMSLFGLLSYAEPALLVVASLLIGERIASGEWFSYGAIWGAVLILTVGGITEIVQSRRR
ncbi:EamA family transporter RarD [Leucobacter sp. UT-8R-CII-1-4]|uniref:EamA family transporter RarD n=1 Tax=Leucobacter sp. UT-8R-CII-1-4 TaxID=3040075 RepID=UPI0024A86F55|nr:EamA family transporter RarD [Leucobacter sp. UT-8R-CII-1-4]MDI6022558.1 EamA family transporter RarD [Leucobacter sp. UT-8R-CII-1-4]